MIEISARVALGVGAALLVISAGAGLYWKGRRDDAAIQKPKIEAATDNGVARGLEVEGERNVAGHVEIIWREERAIQEKTHDVVADIKAGPTAPLDPVSAARLREHDRFLCEQRPDACTDTAAPTQDPPDRL